MVKEVLADQALLVTTPLGVGRVDITDISDHYVDNPFEAVKKRKFVK